MLCALAGHGPGRIRTGFGLQLVPEQFRSSFSPFRPELAQHIHRQPLTAHAAPPPAGHQRPEDIHRLLEDAKGASMMAGVLANPSDDGYDASIENAIREDLQVRRASGGIRIWIRIRQRDVDLGRSDHGI